MAIQFCPRDGSYVPFLEPCPRCGFDGYLPDFLRHQSFVHDGLQFTGSAKLLKAAAHILKEAIDHLVSEDVGRLRPPSTVEIMEFKSRRRLGYIDPKKPSVVWIRSDLGAEPKALAFVLAHELRHLAAVLGGSNPSEADADDFALRVCQRLGVKLVYDAERRTIELDALTFSVPRRVAKSVGLLA